MYSHGSEIFNRLNQEKQHFILTQIIKEFGISGYDRVSMRNIAKNTEVSIGSLYQYFGDKEGILKIAIEQIFLTVLPYFEEIEKIPLELDARLDAMFSAISSIGSNHPEIISFYNKIPSDRRIIKEWIKQFHDNKNFFNIYWSTINQLYQNGELNSELDPISYTFILDTLILSEEFFHSIQYQNIKTKVFVDGLPQDSLFLRESIIDSLIELTRRSRTSHEK